MRFSVRKVGQYKELEVTDGGTTMRGGLLDEKECRALAAELREAADDLMHNLDEAEQWLTIQETSPMKVKITINATCAKRISLGLKAASTAAYVHQ